MREIEFVCANSDYPHYTSLLHKHKALYAKLKGMAGIYPYRQDNGGTAHQEYAFAVAAISPQAVEYVLFEARKLSLPVDIIEDVSQNKVDRIVRGEIENQLPEQG